MNSIDELEEGEIEDLSDNDDHQKNTSSTKTHESSVTALKNKSKKSKDGKKLEKHKVSNSGKAGKEVYDMDEFELLLARHQLIQQQLDKVNSQEQPAAGNQKSASSKKTRSKRKRKSTSNDNIVTTTSNAETSADGDDDIELLQMRRALLAQTSRRKSTTDKKEVSKVKDVKRNRSTGSENINNDKVFNNQLQPIELKNQVNEKEKVNLLQTPAKFIGTKKSASAKMTSSSKKRRKRGGKRAKYLAYRAQQKKELEILEQQQAIAFDNYNTVPMDIDNDDENEVLQEGCAPLPLIETTETKPPPPPTDGFHPVEDQASLSMTSSNVAWMPGFVETLEKDVASKAAFGSNISEKEDKENDKQSMKDVEEIDEKEVWALRAQALKSLACKRAFKVKLAKKSKVTPIVKTEGIAQQRKQTLLKDIQGITELSPLPSPSSVPINTSNLLTKYELPIHGPVVITLTKEDFESSDEDSSNNNLKTTEFKNHKTRTPLYRRSSLSDEELLKELQDNINKSSEKVKSHSLLVQQDQLQYRKLNSDLSEKRILFRKQSEEVKTLQARLQAALKEKASTKIAYNALHTKIKDVKLNLKEKQSLRKKVEEELLRAKSIVSVKKLTVDEQGKIGSKMRQHVSMLTDSLHQSYRHLIKIEEKNQESSYELESATDIEVNNKQTVLQKTAASVKNMSKDDLARLELELREKLKKYRNLQERSSATDSTANEQNISIKKLPFIKSQKELNKLKEFVLESRVSTSSSAYLCSGLVNNLQHDEKEAVQKTSITGNFSKDVKKEERIAQETRYNKIPQTNFKYRSPLTVFKSYRLSPYFRTQSKHAINSKTFSNRINAGRILCKYDVQGTCNDDKCSYWHFKDACALSANDILCDLVSYDLFVFDASPSMGVETKQKLLHSFIQQFETQYSGKMSADEVLLLLWNQLKENRKSRKIPIYECVNFEDRNWFSLSNTATLQNQQTKKQSNDEAEIILTASSKPIYYLKNKKHCSDDLSEFESQEVRYFSETYAVVDVMEKSLKENPKDIKLWLSLSRYYLKQDNVDGEPKNVEKALGVLSRSLEENRDCEELWIEYLKLFANNSTADELRELSYQAVMYAATYNVWWACLSLETKYLGKQEICTEMMKFVIESDENGKSHSLMEVFLYLCKHMEGRERKDIVQQCFLAALSGEEYINSTEKIHVVSLLPYLTTSDQAFLWMCYLSLICYEEVPDCMFSAHHWGAKRLVNKRKFVLNWNVKSKNVANEEVRKLFYSALGSFTDQSLVAKKSMMIIYENLVSFELSLGNIQKAGDVLRGLVENEQSLVEAWVLLVLLYVKYSPMDIVVKIAEEAIHKCEHDVVIVYFYSNWLFKQGMPRLALEKLTKCIHVYFQFEAEDIANSPDILFLYKKVLGLEIPYTISLPTYMPKSSQQLNFYYWLCYCLLLKIKEIPQSHNSTFVDATEEAFEAAVHQYTSRENTKKLWGAYIDHKLEPLKNSQDTNISAKNYNDIIELVTRSIVSIPATSMVQENPNVLWKDYEFQNDIIAKCLPYIPTQQQSTFFEKLISLMPDNLNLALRICEHETRNNNSRQVRVICGSLLQRYPTCLQLWRVAIGVECKCNSIKEARWMYEEATKANPFCSLLWKEYAHFEINYTTSNENLDKVLDTICDRALNNGIHLGEYLQSLSVR